jgi:trehalose/maltose hydrolase-like predicted phosphorylase
MIDSISRTTLRAILSTAFTALMLAGECSAAESGDVWSIDSGPLNVKHYFGESMANGMIGLLSSSEPFRTQQTIIYGAFEPMWPGGVPAAAHGFNFLDLDLRIDGTRIVSASQIQHFRQVLDLQKAILTTTFDYDGKATVAYSLRALRNLPYSALLEVKVAAHKPIALDVASRLDAPRPGQVTEPSAHTFAWLKEIKHSVTGVSFGTGDATRVVRLSTASAKGASGGITIAAAQTFLFSEEHKEPALSSGQNGVSFNRKVGAGEEFDFASLGSTITSAHVNDPFNEVQRITAEAATRGLGNLILAHERAWAALWQSDVLIEGDDSTQRDVHNIIYHLYASVREGTDYSIPPMGLSGNSHDYFGHVFWDAEMWMLPGLLALRPELARAMLEYRFQRLDAARRNAARHGYRGAQFPWESAASGDEDTWVEASTGAIEIHVTADVALAAWNYFRVTQDKGWLTSRGFPMIQGAADFWASRVSREGPGRYCIRHVTAADEDADNVDNDAFTNAAAKETLRIAAEAARIIGATPNADWTEVAQNIPIDKFPDGVTREYELYRGEKTSQGDVTLLAYPLEVITDRAEIERDLAYYSVDRYNDQDGPAMMIQISSLLYERLDQPERAFELLHKGYRQNQRPPFGAIAESARSDNPYFMTAAGGLLQTILYGFGGLRITDMGLRQVPAALPSQWRSITLTGIGPESRTFFQK